MRKDDINVLQFAEMMCYLEPHPELTTKLDRWKNPYTSEKAHMCIWFGSQETTGSGSYIRGGPNSSAEVAYNRLLCPGGMLWIAEALGETPQRLKEAVQAARKAEKKHWRARGNGFREVIPFSRIYELYQHPEGWIYEKKLLQLIERDEKGYPRPANEDVFWEILNSELK